MAFARTTLTIADSLCWLNKGQSSGVPNVAAGGAFTINQASAVSITGSLFDSNSAGRGGAIAVNNLENSGVVVIRNSTFVHNGAPNGQSIHVGAIPAFGRMLLSGASVSQQVPPVQPGQI
ncbi:MAG: hypothetical protein ABIO49_13450 [Dokdonella sp.]